LDGANPFPQPVSQLAFFSSQKGREWIPGAGLETRRPVIAEFSHRL
jgi:hypothetical protein